MISVRLYSYLFWWGLCYLYLLMYVGVKQDFFIRWYSWCFTVKQELIFLPEHLNSVPIFSRVHVAQSLAQSCPFYFGNCCFCSSINGLVFLVTDLVFSNISWNNGFIEYFWINKLTNICRKKKQLLSTCSL